MFTVTSYDSSVQYLFFYSIVNIWEKKISYMYFKFEFISTLIQFIELRN